MTVEVSSNSIHTRTHKISYPGAPSSYAEKLAKGEIEGKKSARGKPIKRGKCQFLLDFVFPPLEEVSLSHFSYLSYLVLEIWIRKLSRVLCGGGVCENYLMNTGLKSSHIHISSQSLRISAIASHTVSEGFSL